MSDKKIYSIGALFDTADDIIRASKETIKAGYKKFDTNTPYPVHGIDRAMGLGPSKIGYFTLIYGLAGAAIAFAFMTWVTSVDYPLVIGGKPFFTWPAFVPITFEITVLSAAVLTVVTLIAIYFRFPTIGHPVHDTNYMKKVSSDKFGLQIAAIDSKFSESEIKAFLERLGGQEIEVIYHDEQGEQKVLTPRFLGVIFGTILLTAGGTYFTLNHLIYMHPFNWMENQDKVYLQDRSKFYADQYSMRMPVEGSVARGFIPYEYTGMPDSVVKHLANPLPVSKEVLDKGKMRFDTYCSPCHGYFGKGDARLNNQFPNPPTLHSEKVRNWADGNIYNVITNGQNVMPPYYWSVTREDRWAIVHYIRALQRSQNAPDSDLETK
jgi:mono/diheme cytochrome c family protein